MKYYDIEKVEALLMEIGDTHDEDLPPEIVEAAAAVRSSAREVPEASEEEIERLIALHAPDRALYDGYGEEADLAEFVIPVVRAALARFGQQGGRLMWAIVNEGPIEAHGARWSAEGAIERGERKGRIVPCRVVLLDETGEEGRDV